MGGPHRTTLALLKMVLLPFVRLEPRNLNPSTTLGDIEYRSATANTNTRLAIGSTGQVLTVSGGVPAWSTIASGSLTLLSTTSITGTSVTISNISQSYKKLYVIVTGVTNDVSNRSFLCLPNNNSTATHYVVFYKDTTSSVANYTPGASQLPVLGSDAAGFLRTGAENAAAFEIDNYTSGSTISKTFYSVATFRDSGNTFRSVQNAFGSIEGLNTITSLVFRLDNSGNMTAGTILLYGVN